MRTSHSYFPYRHAEKNKQTNKKITIKEKNTYTYIVCIYIFSFYIYLRSTSCVTARLNATCNVRLGKWGETHGGGRVWGVTGSVVRPVLGRRWGGVMPRGGWRWKETSTRLTQGEGKGGRKG